tara:strand:+ start:574 stop:2052 length:1479 start_codon:yes stop_codon:yes gene_type:complete
MKLELLKISKFFPGIKALSDVNFSLKKNSIHALIGENGAGKSTLVKILCGVYQPDEGVINIDSKKIQISDPNQSLKHGISAIHQESVMFDELTVMENIFIGNHILKKNKLIDWSKMISKSNEILSRLETDIKSNDKIKDLSIAQRHIVQISRSLAQDAEIVIMDEPTAALSQKEIQELYKIIKNLQKQDKSIIFISHKLDEIIEICDEYTVLRDGKVVSTNQIINTNKNDLISHMVGREINQIFPKKKVDIGKNIFIAENLSKKTQFKDISFKLKHKEILGFYGLIGSGRSEIMKAIFGINQLDSGKILFNDKKVIISKPLDAINHGIVYLSEERQNLGLTGTMSVKDNLNMAMMNKNSRYFFSDEKKNLVVAKKFKEKLNIKVSYWSQLAQSLSGGNQQKTVIGKWLATQPKIIILDEPTKGIDIGSKSAVHEFMGELVNQGMSIIMISSELPEIMGMCDRVAVVYKGLIKKILEVKHTSSEEIISYASGE